MGRGVGGCQGDIRYEVIIWKKGERQVEQDNIQCSFEHGDLAFQWRPFSLVTWRPRKAELAGELSVDKRKSKGVKCKEFLSVMSPGRGSSLVGADGK